MRRPTYLTVAGVASEAEVPTARVVAAVEAGELPVYAYTAPEGERLFARGAVNGWIAHHVKRLCRCCRSAPG